MDKEKKHWSEHPIFSGIIVAIFTTLFTVFINKVTPPDSFFMPEETRVLEAEQQFPLETTIPEDKRIPHESETVTEDQEESSNGSQVQVELDRIMIKTAPSKKVYFVGESLETKGMVLEAVYSNGATEQIKGGFICEPTTMTVAGTGKIRVTYRDKAAFFEVVVENVWSDWMTELPDGVSLSKYEIQEKTQYASSRITAWHTLSDGVVGLSQYDFFDHTEYTTVVGEWSLWSSDDDFFYMPTTKPAVKNYYSREEEEEKATQYRSCEWSEDTKRYGEWSEWQFDEITATEFVKVEMRTVTRKRQVVVYSTRYYYRVEDGLWENPAFGDIPIQKDENTAVRTRTVYRYREKVS